MEWNTVERGIKTETEKKEQNKKEWASSVGLCPRHILQHTHHVKTQTESPTDEAAIGDT